MCMNLENIAQVAQVIIALAAIIGIFFNAKQYNIFMKQLKTDAFIRYSANYSMSKEVSTVVKYLEQMDGLKHKLEVVGPDSHDIEIFMHYFEEIELLIESKIMDEQMVYDMFSYYLFVFERNIKEFDIEDYESNSWSIFRHLLVRLNTIKTKRDENK